MMNTHLPTFVSRFNPARIGIAATLLLSLPGGCAGAYDDELEDEAVAESEAVELRTVTTPTVECPASSGIRVWPISGQTNAVQATDVIQDVYGAIIRDDGDYNHGGVDFRAPTGTPIHAVADGFVTRKCVEGQSGCSGHAGKGNWLLLQHLDAGPNGETLYTTYAHMSSFDTDGMGTVLAEGECVAAGDVVGLVGQTGDAETEHLHLSLHSGLNRYRSPVNGNSRNPWLVLPDKPNSVDYTAAVVGVSGSDKQLRVEAEAQYANIARVEAVQFVSSNCQNSTCHAAEIGTRVLEWDGGGVLACGSGCPDFDISAIDFDPGDYQSPLDPNNPADVGDVDHVWDLFITPVTATAGDERFRVYDVFDRLVAEGPLD